MKIGIFTDVYFPYVSGVVTAVDSLRKALEKDGNEVYIITINADIGKKRYKKDGKIIKIPGIPTPKGLYEYYFRIAYPLKAVKIVENLDLDIIHIHTEGMIGNFGKSMAKKLNIPVVHTFHTMYEDYAAYITKGLFPKLSKEGAKIFVKSFFHPSPIKEVITPGEKPRFLLKNKYHIKQNVTVIPNGIDTEIFDKEKYKIKDLNKLKEKYKINPNDFVILWVGRLGYEKNIGFLIEAHKKILETNKNTKLLIVGAGPEEDKLFDLATRLDILDSVIFAGKIANSDVGKFYQIATIFATASITETQGLTLIEALASSTPVICIRDSSFFPIVKNNYNGFYFKTKREYVSIINDLCKDKKKLLKMNENAQISSEDYSLSSFAKKVEKVYSKALNEKVNDNDY